MLSAAGTPADRVEEALRVCAQELGIKGEFFSMPTALLATFESAEEPQPFTKIVRVRPGPVDLERLADIDRVFNDVADGRLGPADGLARLDEIADRSPRYPELLSPVSTMIIAAAAATILGGGIREALASAVIGLLVGGICLTLGKRGGAARLVDFVCGAISAMGAGFIADIVPLRADLVAIASLITLLPGLTLTTAINELSTRNLVSGTARLMGAFTMLLALGFGVAVGMRSIEALGAPAPIGDFGTLPAFYTYIALAAAAVAFAVEFRAHPRQLWILITAGYLGFFAATLSSPLLGAELSAAAGALAVGMFANAYARLFNKPATIALIPGVILLVPGTLGIRGVRSIVSHDTLTGVDTLFSMLLIATALVAGLLAANVLIPPRKAL